MNDEKAIEILKESVRKDNSLYALSLGDMGGYLDWGTASKEITLDGEFTIDQLEAIVYWMKNKSE